MNRKQKQLDKAIAGMKSPRIRKDFQDAIAANREKRKAKP